MAAISAGSSQTARAVGVSYEVHAGLVNSRSGHTRIRRTRHVRSFWLALLHGSALASDRRVFRRGAGRRPRYKAKAATTVVSRRLHECRALAAFPRRHHLPQTGRTQMSAIQRDTFSIITATQAGAPRRSTTWHRSGDSVAGQPITTSFSIDVRAAYPTSSLATAITSDLYGHSECAWRASNGYPAIRKRQTPMRKSPAATGPILTDSCRAHRSNTRHGNRDAGGAIAATIRGLDPLAAVLYGGQPDLTSTKAARPRRG